MAVPKPGELWVPAQGELKRQALDDYRTLLQQNGFDTVETFEGTEVDIRFTAIETMLQPVFYNIAIKADASSEQTATGADLEQRLADAGLPPIPPSRSVGYVTVTVFGTGGRVFADGLEGKLENGLFVQVSGTQAGIENGGRVRVRSREPGKSANVAAGTEVVWTTPPFNVAAKATVAAPGLRGGTDEESEEQKRTRIGIRRQTRAGGGNWGHAVEVAMAADASIQAAFAYPAIGGPSSCKVALVKALDESSSDFSRAVPDDTVTLATAAVFGEMPGFAEFEVQSAVDEDVDVTLALGLAGNGWRNTLPWPVASVDGRVTVYSVGSTTEITILKSETNGNAPYPGAQIMWWSPTKQRWVTSTVVVADDDGATWTVSLDAPLVIESSGVAAGDFLSPAAFDSDAHRAAWLAQMNGLGPGENTTSASILNHNPTRGFRRPYGYESFPFELSSRQTNAFQRAFRDVIDVDYLYRSQSKPTVPGSITTAPNVLRLRHFAVYPST